MRQTFAPGVGGVLSADIAVPDHEREVAFYSSILTTGESPLWRDDLMNNRGTPIIGLGARTPEYETLPLQWMPHFQVADIAASVARAVELGGAELMHGRDDAGQSQWAVLTDPAGAGFGLIPVVAAEGDYADLTGRIGRITGLTLAVPDPAASQSFYQQVIGWTAREIKPDGDGDSAHYEMLRGDDIPAADIRANRGEYEPIPPAWLIALPVGDLRESLQRVRAGGGEVLMSNSDEGSAVIRDPVGVYIALQGR